MHYICERLHESIHIHAITWSVARTQEFHGVRIHLTKQREFLNHPFRGQYGLHSGIREHWMPASLASSHFCLPYKWLEQRNAWRRFQGSVARRSGRVVREHAFCIKRLKGEDGRDWGRVEDHCQRVANQKGILCYLSHLLLSVVPSPTINLIGEFSIAKSLSYPCILTSVMKKTENGFGQPPTFTRMWGNKTTRTNKQINNAPREKDTRTSESISDACGFHLGSHPGDERGRLPDTARNVE